MRRRRWLWFYIVLMLILLYSPFSYGAVSEAETAAKELQTLGLFQGTERGYELGRDATREEAVAMLVRLLGKENEAYQGQWAHPFTDVSRWAQPYVCLLYTSTNDVPRLRFVDAHRFAYRVVASGGTGNSHANLLISVSHQAGTIKRIRAGRTVAVWLAETILGSFYHRVSAVVVGV